MDGIGAFTDKDYDTYFKENFSSLVDVANMPPELLAAYSFESCINETGIKSVYKVKHKQSHALGLLKITHDKSVENARIEADLLNSLQHPGIPRVLDFGEHNGSAYLIREYFEGIPLNIQHAKSGDFPVSEILDAALKIGVTLDYLEKLDVVHRDIKPGNIILTDEKEYKLIDFGITRKYDAEKTHDTIYAGTKGYTAPEQLGDFGQTTPSADRYSFGKTLLFMATGTSDLVELAKIKDAGLMHLIEILTDYDPKKRFRSVADMMNHVRYLMDGIDPLSIEGDRVSGNILTSYTGNDQKLVLYDVAYIFSEAFAERGKSIVEIRLCANFSSTSMPALKMLENLASIEVDENNDDLVGYDGVLYDKQTCEMLLFPPRKTGLCQLPSWIKTISAGAYEGMCAARALTDTAIQTQIFQTHPETGNVDISSTVARMQAQNFFGCTAPENVFFDLNWDELCSSGQLSAWLGTDEPPDSHGQPLCALFDGCAGLPEKFHHDVCLYDLDPKQQASLKCTYCNDIVAPPFRPTLLADAPMWSLTGEKIIWEYGLREKIHEDLKEFTFSDIIPQGTVLHRVKWTSNEIHSGVIKGTPGGWIEDTSCLGHMAWVENGAVILRGGRVFGMARLGTGAIVDRGALVFDKAVVAGGALLQTGTQIYGHALVMDAWVVSGHVYGHAKVIGDENERISIKGDRAIPRIFGNAMIENSARIGDGAIIYDYAYICENAEIYDARVYGRAKVSGTAMVLDKGVVCDDARVSGNARISWQGIACGNAKITGNTHIRRQVITGNKPPS